MRPNSGSDPRNASFASYASGKMTPQFEAVDPLSPRAVIAGMLVGFVVSAMNVSFGLKAGWGQGGSVLAAAVSIGLFSAIKPKIPFTQLEANVCQTVASAAGSMTMAAGLIGPIPALHLLGMRYSVWTMMTWGASVAFLGVFFAVPLRRHFLLESQLRFPSGTATAETIKSMFADARRAKSQVGTLVNASAFAACTVVFTWCFPWALRPPLFATLGMTSAARWGWGVRFDATLVGGGILMGTRVGLSVFLGGICAWGLVGPWTANRGWTSGDPLSMKGGARGLLLWPGVTMMAVDSLTQLALATVCRPRRRRKGASSKQGSNERLNGKWTYDDVNADGSSKTPLLNGDDTPHEPGLLKAAPDSTLPKSKPTLVGWAGIEDGNVHVLDGEKVNGESSIDSMPTEDHPDGIPQSWWIIGLMVTSVWTASVLHLNFGLALWQPALALPVAAVMSYVAVRCTGETDINPIGPMGKIIQLVFALVAPGAIVTNLMAAAVACGGAGQAGDLMHDFRAGLMMRLSPRKQLLAQLMGIPVGILGAVPTYALFAATYPIGGEQFPAPAAIAWRAVAEVLTGPGGGGLPAEAKILMAAAAAFTCACRAVERLADNRAESHPSSRTARWIKRLMISPTSMGIAFIIPPEFSTTIALAAIGSGYWERRHREHHEDHAYIAASGLLAGAGVMGVVTALVSMAFGTTAPET